MRDFERLFWAHHMRDGLSFLAHHEFSIPPYISFSMSKVLDLIFPPNEDKNSLESDGLQMGGVVGQKSHQLQIETPVKTQTGQIQHPCPVLVQEQSPEEELLGRSQHGDFLVGGGGLRDRRGLFKHGPALAQQIHLDPEQAGVQIFEHVLGQTGEVVSAPGEIRPNLGHPGDLGAQQVAKVELALSDQGLRSRRTRLHSPDQLVHAPLPGLGLFGHRLGDRMDKIVLTSTWIKVASADSASLVWDDRS